jgi:hypothetical protein
VRGNGGGGRNVNIHQMPCLPRQGREAGGAKTDSASDENEREEAKEPGQGIINM